MKKFALVLLVLLTIGMTACQPPAAPQAAPATAAPAATIQPAAPETKKDLNFVILYKGVHPWYDPAGEGFQAAAKEIGGINARIAAPTTWSGEAQAKMMEDLIAEGVDGIAVAVYDVSALTPVINEAMNRGIPVVAFDAGAADSKEIMFIGTDNPNAGRQQGEAFAKVMGNKGKYIIFVQDLVSQNVKERVEGIRSVAKQHPDMVEVTSEQSTQYSPEEGLKRAEDILNTYPDLAGVVDTGMDGGISMYKTLKERKAEPGSVKIIPWTSLPPIPDAVKEGYLTGTMNQNPYGMGYLAAHALDWYIKGKRPAQKFFDTGIDFADKSTVSNVESNIARVPQMLKDFQAMWK